MEFETSDWTMLMCWNFSRRTTNRTSFQVVFSQSVEFWEVVQKQEHAGNNECSQRKYVHFYSDFLLLSSIIPSSLTVRSLTSFILFSMYTRSLLSIKQTLHIHMEYAALWWTVQEKQIKADLLTQNQHPDDVESLTSTGFIIWRAGITVFISNF